MQSSITAVHGVYKQSGNTANLSVTPQKMHNYNEGCVYIQDSKLRGTQLRTTVESLLYGIHKRGVACPSSKINRHIDQISSLHKPRPTSRVRLDSIRFGAER